MNKKFFSAVLMGALLLGGTFVSCQDYDDDIENLQNQIDKLASADQLSAKVSELQGLISTAQSAASGAQSAADAAKKSAGDADAKAVAAQKAADDLKAAAAKDYATKEEAAAAKAAADAAQKVADEAKLAAAAGLTAEDVDAAVAKAVEGFATVEALQEVADQLAAIQEAIEKCASADDLADLAEKVAALEGKVPGASAAAVLSAVAPHQTIKVAIEEAKWTVVSSKKDKALFEVLAEKFPEIKDYTKNQLMKQGGHLPVIINPAAVELTEDYQFSLQSCNSAISNAVINNPQRGFVGYAKILPVYETTYKTTTDSLFVDANGAIRSTGTITDKDTLIYVTGITASKHDTGDTYMQTKAGKDDCIWTLDVELPVKNGSYDNVTGAALVVETPEGDVVKTAFAYNVTKTTLGAVTVTALHDSVSVAYNAKGIDVLSATGAKMFNGIASTASADKGVLFEIANEMNDHYILSVDEPADVEKFGITIEGSKLFIGNYPSNQETIEIRNVNVLALGLNGTVAQDKIKSLVVSKSIATSTTLSDQEIELNTVANAAGKYLNPVLYDIAELGLSAANLETIMKNNAAGNANVTVSWVKSGSTKTKSYELVFFDVNGAPTTDYKKATQFGFAFESKDLAPKFAYTVLVKVGTLYAASGKMTVVNPGASKAIALYKDLCDANGVLQITGDSITSDGKFVVYKMAKGIEYNSSVITLGRFTDLDAEEAADGDATEYANLSWIKANAANDSLVVYTYGQQVGTATYKDLYKVRNFKVKYTLFNNSDNTAEFEFQAQVVSEIYNSDPSKVINLDKSKLTAVFGNWWEVQNQINLSAAAATGKYAAGPNRGRQYDIYGWTTSGASTKFDYNEPDSVKVSSAVTYVLNGSSRVKIDEIDYKKALCANPDGTLNMDSTYYVTTKMWKTVMDTVKTYYAPNAQGDYVVDSLVWIWRDAKGNVLSSINTGSVVTDLTTLEEGTGWYHNVIDGGKNTVLNTAEDALINRYNAQTNHKGWDLVKKSDVVKPSENQKTLIKFYNAYKSKISFKDLSNSGKPTLLPAANGKISGVSFEFVNEQTASKFATLAQDQTDKAYKITAKDVLPEDVPGGKVELDVKMTVEDIWGMTMEYVFPVTLKTAQ